MSDEDSPKYKDGDIVWVKLGSRWWPGEVTENAPEDFTSKKPPLAIVKFFNESTYEFVKSPNNIYLYNCERKNEFIKKGMDSFRGNNSHMEKFPGDVSLAEQRTDGNPNILSDPIFGPQKRNTSIVAEVFGTPKKTPKDGPKQSRGRPSKSPSKKPKINITHRRFLGCDDYEAHVRVQYPGKDTEHVSDDEEIVRLNAEPNEAFDCWACSFKTNRVDVMLFHVQCHIKGVTSPAPVKKKVTPKKKKAKVKHITSDNDRTNSSADLVDSESEEAPPKPKKKKIVKKSKPKQIKKVEEEKPEPVTDIRTDLLAEWSDSDEADTSQMDTSGEIFNKKEEIQIKKPEETNNVPPRDTNKSCFDFEEEEETSVVHAAVGRKIPRVIPPNEKRKSSELDNRVEILKMSESFSENSNEPVKDDLSFKDLMESTSVPDLPEVPDVKSKTDKKSDVATKLTNPKKRFVKSFEDFELLQNEQRKAQEEREEELRREKESAKAVVVQRVEPIVKETVEADAETEENLNDKKLDGNVQISKLKCQIMSKLSDEDESPKAKGKTSHRTPRSKILETYRMNEQKTQKHTEPTETEKDTPKKTKLSKPSGIEKIEEEDTAAKIDVIKEVEAIPEKTNSDEEIGKIAKIDEYFNDFLDFGKKSDEEKPEETASNEVHIKCVTDDNESSDIAIKTNLTNFNKDEKEMSALNTLAMVSELETTEKIEDKKEERPKTPELVPIDGNLTVVSEKDLADGQVEITANASPIYKKPVTLSSFSMDFSDYNSISESTEPKPKEKKKIEPEELFDLEEHIPSQIVDKSKPMMSESSTQPSSKLLERLTTADSTKKVPTTKDSPKPAKKLVIKSAVNKVSKPIVIAEVIKPEVSGVSVQKITAKRNFQDPDEIDTFIIQKGAKTVEEDEEEEELEVEIPAKKKKGNAGADLKKVHVSTPAALKKRGKAKILQQTIITPAGEIIPSVAQTSVTDDNVFDINSMPIVLSDQILTPESIENMPIFLSETVQTQPVSTPSKTIVKKPVPSTPRPTQMRLLNRPMTSPKLIKTPKILGTMGTKIIKQNSFAATPAKHSKYVIVTQASPVAQSSKYTVGKKQIIKKDVPVGTLTKVQNLTPEPSGNKIMILTNQQGHQQRVLLTPAQQKMMGYQTQGPKIAKTLMKGSIIQKGKDGQITAIPSSSGLISKGATPRLNTSQTLISSSGHVLTPIHTQGKTIRIEKSIPAGRKLQMQSQKVPLKPQQKTILIKNQHGQTVRKIQGTDDALLDQQVAEQIEAIKASGVLQQKQDILNYKSTPRTFRRSYAKKPMESPKIVQKKIETTAMPPLAPISPKKPETHTSQKEVETKQDRPLHQLVIQDAMGNQTTITEGQILALPSETVDGQPQSYMLVTLDESGNLTPLNNEALLSLDPNLGLGGDLSNTVLQIDQSALKEETVTTQEEPVESEPPKPEPVVEPPPPEVEEIVEKIVEPTEVPEESTETSVMQTVGETGQQLIVTGDPIAAQKFLESLTEGNTDLANILASAEGSSILIHADGQQILINTDTDNQMLLSVNTNNLGMADSSEGGGNPIFATQPKNQDILAAALADTDVFQQEQNGSHSKILQSQLSPSSTLYPMNVGNVLETSLTLNSPIMTPLEVPSSNIKKIADENEILSQIPKNVDLPITITDPNIVQTVAQQQVASLMANELQNNLELSLPISDTAVTSTEMNSPSFVYSLPNLDGSDMNHKPFNSSMPLLTEDAEENDRKSDKEEKNEDEKIEDKNDDKIPGDGSFLDESEGLCTLGSEMCSSLSEPPPDMFDLSAVLSQAATKDEPKLETDDKGGDESVSSESVNPDTTETSSPNTVNEDSCEIPVQPEIVTCLKDDGFDAIIDKTEELENESKCKFD